MNEVSPTIKQPLKKLEYLFLGKGIERAKESFFDKYIKLKQKYPKTFDIHPDEVIVQVQGYMDATETLTYTLEDEIRGVLYREINNAKELISKAVAEITFNEKSPDLFLSVQAKDIEKLYEGGYPIIEEYPFSVSMLNEIITHINSFLVKYQRFLLLESVDKGDVKSIIPEMFDFLNTRKIISSNEYQKLLRLIDTFLDNYDTSKLTINKKIDIKDENKSLVRFCFYLLQKAQPNSRGTKEYFIDFIKKVFTNFEKDTSLGNHFAEPPKVKLSWYPDRVKEAM